MAANEQPVQPSPGTIGRAWIAFVLIFVAASIVLVVAGVSSRYAVADPAVVAAWSAACVVQLTMAGCDLTPILTEPPPLARFLPELLYELAKQVIEQCLHFALAALPIWLSRRFTGVPWFGVPVIVLLVFREWLQWPSERWWDPPLDLAVLMLGFVIATWAFKTIRRPVHGSAFGRVARPK